jgi:hypothetical protein
MAYTNAQREIGLVVDRFLLKNQLTNEDYACYLENACDCYRDICVKHDNRLVTAKVSISALGIITMPDDMIGFSNLFIPLGGQFWSFTDIPRKVTTTTTTDGVEGQDTEQGEGVDINKDVYWGLGGVGGVNPYGRTIRWDERRIYCDGIKSDTAVLVYNSDGLKVGETTYVPIICEETIDRYLLWKKSEIEAKSMSSITYNEKKYEEALLKLRIFNFLPTKDELEDAWNNATTQSVQR